MGNTHPVGVALDRRLLAEIDNARGPDMSRSKMINAMIERGITATTGYKPEEP
jgi:metal-responsive CopG/Arc/MetJ family transcriptional regulator